MLLNSNVGFQLRYRLAKKDLSRIYCILVTMLHGEANAKS